jgi:hypothetical protein
LWKEFSYSHRIDIEPTPYAPVSWDELHQRLRKINFDINKKYLKTSYFPKWKLEDRFWFVGCREGGDGTGSAIHYHLLLYTPANHRIDAWNDLYWGWMKGSPLAYSRKGVDRQVFGGLLENGGKSKTIKVLRVRKPTIIKHHIGAEDYDRKFLINVEPVRGAKGSVIYNTKKMHPKMEREEEFICIQ